MRLLLMGPPGSGKGTQGERIAQALNVPHVATGDIIREQIVRRTPFGRRIETIVAQGNFAPDDDMLYCVQQRLLAEDAQSGCVLDGFPRDLAQAQAFDTQFVNAQAFDAVLELVVREDILIERLAGRLVCPVCRRVYHVIYCLPQKSGLCDAEGSVLIRRPDDAPASVRHRLEVYEAQTLPMRDYYAAQDVLRTVEAEGDPNDVAQRLVGSLAGWTSGPKIAHLGV